MKFSASNITLPADDHEREIYVLAEMGIQAEENVIDTLFDIRYDDQPEVALK